MPKRLLAIVAVVLAVSAAVLAAGSAQLARADPPSGSTGSTGSTGPAGPTCDPSLPICYVSPSGTSADACTADDPCDLATAVGAAVSGDTIEIGAGNYTGIPAISDAGEVLNFVGVGGQPSIVGNVAGALVSLGTSGSSLENLSIENQGGIALSLGGGVSADRVLATASGRACQFTGGVTLTNSVCTSSASGQDVPVLDTTGTNTLVNDDIWGMGEASGIEGDSGQDTVVNTIVSADDGTGGGGGADLVAEPLGAAQMTFNVSYSSYLSEAEYQGSSSTFNNSNNQTMTVPKLADPGSGNFQESPGSPTIGEGTSTDPASGPLDLYGNPRQTTTTFYFSYVPATANGTQTPTQSLTTTDIGADQAQGAPNAVALEATGISSDSATLTGAIAPDGGGIGLPVTAVLSGLTTGQTYYFELIAGSTTSPPPLASFTAGVANSSSSGGGSLPTGGGTGILGGGGDTGNNLNDLAGASITATTARVNVKKVAIPISCGGVANCTGNIHFIAIVNEKVKVKGKTLSERKVVGVASGSYAIATGASGTATLKLSPGAAALLAAHKGKLAGLLEVTPTGALSTAEQHFTLTAKVKKAKAKKAKPKSKPKPKPKKKG